MPKSGKSRGKSRKRGTETDPLAATRSRDGAELDAPKRSARKTQSLSPYENTDSLPDGLGPLGPMDDARTPYDEPPQMDSSADAQLSRRPAASRARKGKEPTGDDAWASFDEERGDSWLSISSSDLAEEPSSPVRGRQGSEARTGDDVKPQSRSGRQSRPEPSFPTEKSPSAGLPARVRLVALSGPDTGREYALSQHESSVGRGADCTIVIADPSVSREHARIVLDKGGQFFVVDRRSGNGTFVNGQRVDRARLSPGDEVAFGNVALRFLQGEAPAQAGPSLMGGEMSLPTEAVGKGGPGSRRTAWLFAGATLVVVLLAGISLYRRTRGTHNSEEVRREVFEHFVKGVDAFKGHQWADADQQFSVVLGLDPQHGRAGRYRKAIVREQLAESQLVEARASRKRRDLVRAYALALGILDSTFRGDAQQIMKDIDTELDAQVNRAQSALDVGQAAEAQGLLQIVEQIHPGRPDVAALLVRANLKNDLGHVPPSSLAGRAAVRRRPAVTFSGAVGEAHRAFVMGNGVQALELLEPLSSEEAASLRDKIEKFNEAYQTGLSEHRAKRAANAVQHLTQAKALEAKISGGSCKLLPDIDQKLADMYYVLGMQGFLKGAYPEAYQNFHAAVALLPDHVLSARKLSELAQKGQEMLDASVKQSEAGDTAKARGLLRTVIEIVPPDSEIYRKAKSRLDALP